MFDSRLLDSGMASFVISRTADLCILQLRCSLCDSWFGKCCICCRFLNVMQFRICGFAEFCSWDARKLGFQHAHNFWIRDFSIWDLTMLSFMDLRIYDL